MRRVIVAVALAVVLIGASASSAVAAPRSTIPSAAGPIGISVTAQEQIGPGVTHTTMTVTGAAGPSVAQLLTIHLRGRTRMGLLTPGVVAARMPVDQMARQAGAIAATNGDYFNLFEDASHGDVAPTDAASGAEIQDGRLLKGAVPFRQRYGETGAQPLNNGTEVFGVTTSRRAVVGRVRVVGQVSAKAFGSVPLDGLNQYGIDRDGIEVFTPEWGPASRARAACGSQTSRRDPCTTDVTEVAVRHNRVVSVSDHPGAGQLPKGTIVLFGRETGADTLRTLSVGDHVRVGWHAAATAHYRWAVGGSIIEDDDVIPDGLDQRPNPRTAVGASADGRTVYLIAVDGHSTISAGITIDEIAHLLRELGARNAVTLDGGGSTAMVGRHQGARDISVWNVPSDGSVRAVANGIGVFTR